MTKALVLLTAVTLAACNNQYHPPPEVDASDPVRQLNPTKWVANENDLIWPPRYQEP